MIVCTVVVAATIVAIGAGVFVRERPQVKLIAKRKKATVIQACVVTLFIIVLNFFYLILSFSITL